MIDDSLDDEEVETVVSDSSGVAVESFADLELDDIVRESIAGLGWTKPTPVQGMCLPHVTGRDVAGFAQTGTGKTGVFLITIANEIVKLKKSNPKHKGPVAIILVPTRELAVQIAADAQPMFDGCKISL